MDSIPYDSIILLGALLLLSGYFSASETALTSANKIRLRKLSEESNASATRSLAMADSYDKSLSTILIGNNIVNIGMATIATKIATDIFGSQASTLLLVTIFLTILILIFGEILPKTLAKQYAEKYLLSVSASLKLIMNIFYPITWFFVKLNVLVSKVVGSKQSEPMVTDEDVKTMVAIGEEEGTFHTQEKELLNNAIEFDDIVVKDILTPRPDVIGLPVSATLEQIKDIFISEKYSRLPIFEGTIDNIVGILSYRDFFAKYVQEETFDINDILRPPHFVIASVKISTLLAELQKNQVHLAIVLDEYGGTSGIITIEDILEEIVGDIWDEHDENESRIETITDGRVLADGRLSVEEFSSNFNLNDIETNANTLSGWLTETLGYLPKKGEVIKYQSLVIHIEEVRKCRIQKVIVETVEEVTNHAS